MNTAELYIEPILTGALMLALLALPFAPEILELARSKELLTVGGVALGAVLVGLAYFFGIVVDRLIDTCLQPLERHNRLRFALSSIDIKDGDADKKEDREAAWDGRSRRGDLFPEDAHRWRVYAEADKIAESADYVRTRMRLARTLAFLLPGLIFAGVLGAIRLKWATACAIYPRLGQGWCDQANQMIVSPADISWLLFVVPCLYAATVVIMWAIDWPRNRRWQSGKRTGTWRPPHTKRLERVEAYAKRRNWPVGDASELNLALDILAQPIVWCSVILILASVPLIFWLTGSWLGAVAGGLAGLFLAYAAGWSWWRLMRIFMGYLKGAGEFLQEKGTMPQPTHAGAVVYRGDPAEPEFLLVGATDKPSEWVLPKGHIEPAEDPRSTARREVLEETGVTAKVVGSVELGLVSYSVGGETIRVLYYLARRLSEKPSPEGREKEWLPAEQAEARAAHEETRSMLKLARNRLRQAPSS